MTSDYKHLDPFLAASDAASMVSVAKAFGSFGTYADEATSDSLGEDLPQRFDVGIHYCAHGMSGEGNIDTPDVASSRSNYFRETYAYGNDVRAKGIEPFLYHPELSIAAQDISGYANIVPAIVYANLLIPGQELAIHTDVPEFRGANRKTVPQWLLVVMLHSGLFERWRIPIITCVSWFGDAEGGAFAFYPDGPNGPRSSIPARQNSAVLLDTDKVFHGVERVSGGLPHLPPIGQRTRLHYIGDQDWQLREFDRVLAEFSWAEIRYSISWKAYCFKNEEEESLWRSNKDALTVEQILESLEFALRERGLLEGSRPDSTEFALLLAETFIQFPARNSQRLSPQ